MWASPAAVILTSSSKTYEERDVDLLSHALYNVHYNKSSRRGYIYHLRRDGRRKGGMQGKGGIKSKKWWGKEMGGGAGGLRVPACKTTEAAQARPSSMSRTARAAPSR